MIYPTAVLGVMFGYAPPNDTTRPKFVAVGEARDILEAELNTIFADLAALESIVTPVTDDYAMLHARVGAATLAYATAINEVVPSEGPLLRMSLQAIDCVTFARMWMNKAIRAPQGAMRGRLVALARTEIEKAQLAANAAIALDMPVTGASLP